MLQRWKVLRDAGVPEGAARRLDRGSFEPTSVAAALAEATANLEALEPADRECLSAWLAAFRHHWPDRFAATLGQAGDLALQRLGAHPTDANRHLKLRRIAIENLAVLV
jgi:hypothetical protein